MVSWKVAEPLFPGWKKNCVRAKTLTQKDLFTVKEVFSGLGCNDRNCLTRFADTLELYRAVGKCE